MTLIRRKDAVEMQLIKGAYMQRPHPETPAVLALPYLPIVGNHMPIAIGPLMKQKKEPDYIDFTSRHRAKTVRDAVLGQAAVVNIERLVSAVETFMREPVKRGCDQPRRIKACRDTNQHRVRSWLIQSVNLIIRGKDTAMSDALHLAARKSLRKHGTCDPIKLEIDMHVADYHKKEKAKQAAIEAAKPKLPTLDSLMKKALDDNWIWCNDGYYIRATNLDPGVNGFSIVTPWKRSSMPQSLALMSPEEEKKYATRVTGKSEPQEVHCG